MAQQNLEEVLKACIRGEDVVSQILTFSRHSEQKKGPLMISSVVEEAIKLLRTTLPATTEIRQRMESGSGRVLADRTQIQQAVLKGGFVTGGGWIMSPAGAYSADLDLEDKANFGFVSKYKKGASLPTGNTEFQFKAGDLNFHSDEYDWLVLGNKTEIGLAFKGRIFRISTSW